MVRDSNRQADEIDAAKARLRATGESLQESVRATAKHGLLVGVAAAFGTGLLAASGRLRIPRSLRRADMIPKAIAYAKIAKEGMAIANTLLSQKKANHRGTENTEEEVNH